MRQESSKDVVLGGGRGSQTTLPDYVLWVWDAGACFRVLLNEDERLVGESYRHIFPKKQVVLEKLYLFLDLIQW